MGKAGNRQGRIGSCVKADKNPGLPVLEKQTLDIWL